MKKTSFSPTFMLDEVTAAIDADNKELAKEKLQYLWNAVKIQHDGLITQYSLALTWIAETFGEERIGDVWRYLSDHLWKSMPERFKNGQMTYEMYKQFLVMGYMSHYSGFDVEEYEDRTTFCIHDCGVCGKMRKDKSLDTQEGGAQNFGTVRGDYEWAFHTSGMPYYCIHAPFLFSKVGRENGYANMSFEWGSQFDEEAKPCRTTLYKDPQEQDHS